MTQLTQLLQADVTANGIYSAGQSAIIYKAQRNGGAVAGDYRYDDATTDMSIGTSTRNAFALKTGNTRALTIGTSQYSTFAGAIGNGGTTPSNGYAIDITPSGGNIIRSTRGTSVFGSYQSNNSDVYLGTISNNTFTIITNDTVALTLDSSQNGTFSGYVGIGATSPSYKLGVA